MSGVGVRVVGVGGGRVLFFCVFLFPLIKRKMGLFLSKKKIDPDRLLQVVEADKSLRRDGHKQGNAYLTASNTGEGPLVYLAEKDPKGRRRVEIYSFDQTLTHDDWVAMMEPPYYFSIDMFCNILRACVVAKRVFLSQQIRSIEPTLYDPYPTHAGMLLQLTSKKYIAVGGRDLVHFSTRAKIDTFCARRDRAADGVLFAIDAKGGVYTLCKNWGCPKGYSGCTFGLPFYPSYFPVSEWGRFVSPENQQFSRIDQFKKTFMCFDGKGVDDGAYFTNLHLLTGEKL